MFASLSSSRSPSARVGVVLVQLVVAFALVCSTEGRSDGFLAVCDLTPRYHDYASPPLLLPNGYFGGNKSCNGGSGCWTYNMNWADMATENDAYTLRAGDGAPSADATTYVPGQPLDIHLRVLNVRKQFIGLILYATNSTGLLLNGDKIGLKKQSKLEQHIGTWAVRQSDPYLLPNSCNQVYSPTGSTVTHADADVKPVHAKFTWTGPVGGGDVRFRILIKWDGQNRGKFFWPAKELVLKEGKPAPPFAGTQQTVIGKTAAPCADVCANQTPKTPYCHAQAMMDIQTPAQLDAALGTGLGLNTPYLAACPYAGAPQVRTDGFAQFRSKDVAATCPASIQASPPARMPDVCYSSVKADARPICICTSDYMHQTRNPFEAKAAVQAAPTQQSITVVTQQQQKTSAAVGKSSANVMLVAALTLVAGTVASGSARSSRLLLLLSVCLCVVLLSAPVHGHNWLQSQKRANVASVNKPCQARIGRQPHVQVVAGQDFEVEWTSGHGDMANVAPFMFAIVSEANYSQLAAKDITAIMRDYVARAPAASHYEKNSYYQRHHIHYSKVPKGVPNVAVECYNLANGEPRCGNYWREASINASNPDFIVRDASYVKTARKYIEGDGVNGYEVTQQRFKPEYIANDVRVSYFSDVYPWLESVSIFPHPYIGDPGVFTSQSDIVRFHVDARSGPGSYIVYFAWGSYSDCVDVDVQKGTTKIVNRYGSDSAATGQKGEIVRLDHCEFRYVQQAASQCRRMNSTRDATACVNACVNKNRCLIQVVRATNPPGTMELPVNIPYTVQDSSKAQCGAASVWQRVDNGCTPALAGGKTCTAAQIGPLDDDSYVCYEATVWKDQDTGVEEDFRLAKDPSDPAWFSSCIFAKPAGGFVNLPTVAYEEPPWQIAEQCVDCAFQRSLSAVSTNRMPDWDTSLNPVCPDCDVRNTQANVAAASLAGADYSKAGLPYVWRPEPSSSTGGANGTDLAAGGGSEDVNGNGNISGAANGSGKSILDNTLYLALIIAGGGLVLLVASVSLFVVLRRRAAAAAALKRMHSLHYSASTGGGDSELTHNPATGKAVTW